MGAAQQIVVSRIDEGLGEQFAALLFIVLEQAEEQAGVRRREVVFRILDLFGKKKLFIEGAVVPLQLAVIIDILDIHGQAFQPVGQFHAHRKGVDARHLLEIGKLADLHAVQPHLPAQSPSSQRGRFPVVLHKTDIVLFDLYADGLQAFQIQVLDVFRAWLDQYLKLIVVLQAVGVFAITPVLGPSAGLRVGNGYGFGAKRSEKGARMEGSGTHLNVVRLDQIAALSCPIVLQSEDNILKVHFSFPRSLRHCVLISRSWPRSSRRFSCNSVDRTSSRA